MTERNWAQDFWKKGKYHDLLGTNLLLENSNLDSLGEVPELSEFLGMSFSTRLTENSSKEEWVDLIYFSGKDLIVRMRKTIRLEEEPGTSGAGSSQGGPEIQKLES